MSVFRCWLFLLVCLACVHGVMAQPELPTGQEVRSLTFSPNGKLLALEVGSDNKLFFNTHRLELWDVTTGQRQQVIKCELQVATSLTFSPDGTKLLSSGVHPDWVVDNRGRIVMWDSQTGQPIRQLKLEGKEIVFAPSFSPDGVLVAASALDGRPSRLKVWNAQTGQLKHDVTDLGGEPWQVMFTPDGKHLIVTIVEKLGDLLSRSSYKLLVLERNSLRTIHSMQVQLDQPAGFVIAPDSQSLVHFYATPFLFVSEGKHNNARLPLQFHLNLMDLKGDRAPLPLQMEASNVFLSSFTFNPDGAQFLAVAFLRGEQHSTELWRWDTKTGQRLSALTLGEYSQAQAEFAAITPDAQTLAIARGTTVELRRTSDGELLRMFDVS